MSKKKIEKGMSIEDDGKVHFNIERLKAMLHTDMIASLITSTGETVLCEMWRVPDGDVAIYPFAKLLTEEEVEAMTAIPL
jgi:hypothetical protein